MQENRLKVNERSKKLNVNLTKDKLRIKKWITVFVLISIVFAIGVYAGKTWQLEEMPHCGTKYCIESWWQNQTVTVLYCEIYGTNCYLGGEIPW